MILCQTLAKISNFFGNKTVDQCSGANLKNMFFANFLLFSFLAQKALKMTISTSVWALRTPNAGRNIQHIFYLRMKGKSISRNKFELRSWQQQDAELKFWTASLKILIETDATAQFAKTLILFFTFLQTINFKYNCFLNCKGQIHGFGDFF